MPQSLASLHYHIVFSTRNRVPAIRPEWQDRLYEYIGGILRTHGAALRAQAEHHGKQTFNEELIALLRPHEIEYDGRYLFD